jgi:hypothetical protein
MNEDLYKILTCRFKAPAEKIEAIKNNVRAIKDEQNISIWCAFICMVCKAMSKYYKGMKTDWLVLIILDQIEDDSIKARVSEAMTCILSAAI